MIEMIKYVVRIIIRGASCFTRFVLGVVFVITLFVGFIKFILLKVWGIDHQKFRLRVNNAVTLICLELFPSLANREKLSFVAIIVMAITITTFPICLCLVPLSDLSFLLVQKAQRTFLHNLVTTYAEPAVCLWLIWVWEKRTPRLIHYVAEIVIDCSIICISGYFRRKKSTDSDPQTPIVVVDESMPPSTSNSKLKGLRNLGNTCYFNSVMQSLCNTDIFYSELQKTDENGKLTLSFHNLMEEMRNRGTGALDPTKVRYDFVKNVSRFDNRGQHDSHECLRHFLDEIRKEQRKTMAGSIGSLTTIDKIFGGHLATVYICKECDKHYHLFEPCLDISLPVFFESETEHMKSENHGSRTEKLVNIEKEKDISSTDEQNPANCDESKGSEMESINQGEKRHEGSKVHTYDDQQDNYKRSVRKLTKRLAFQSTGHLANDDCMHSVTKKEFNMSSYSKTAISLDDCLKHFSRVEQINAEYLCEDCLRVAMARGEADEDHLKLTSATKQTLIFNPPAILTIHFKRFELLPGRSRKRSDMVEYPEHLDIAPYCSSQCLRNDPPRNNIWYSLYAVVVHSGSLEGGHYVAYVKAREETENVGGLSRFIQDEYFNINVTSDELFRMMNKEKQEKNKDNQKPERKEESKWYLMNDSYVHEVTVGEVLEQEAYLLFYERVDL